MGDGPGEGFGTVVGREEAVAPAAGPEDQELDSVINGNDLLGEDDDLVRSRIPTTTSPMRRRKSKARTKTSPKRPTKTMKMAKKTI